MGKILTLLTQRTLTGNNRFLIAIAFKLNRAVKQASGVSLTSWGEGASLALVGHPSSDGVTIKMPYGVDVLHQPALHPIFSYWVG